MRFSQLDYQFNKGIKHSDSLNIGSSPYLFAEEPKLKKETSSFILNDLPNDVSDLSELQDNVFEHEQLEEFLKDQINEDYLTSMSKVTIEPKKLSRLPGDKVFQSENQIGRLFNRGAAATKKRLLGNTFGSFAQSGSIRKDNLSDDQLTQLSRRTSGITEQNMLQSRGRKKLGTFFDKSFNSLATMQMADIDPNAAKEERGPDLPDDELIGNLVGIYFIIRFKIFSPIIYSKKNF